MTRTTVMAAQAVVAKTTRKVSRRRKPGQRVYVPLKQEGLGADLGRAGLLWSRSRELIGGVWQMRQRSAQWVGA